MTGGISVIQQQRVWLVGMHGVHRSERILGGDGSQSADSVVPRADRRYLKFADSRGLLKLGARNIGVGRGSLLLARRHWVSMAAPLGQGINTVDELAGKLEVVSC